MKKLKKVLIFAAIVVALTCLLCVALNATQYSGNCGKDGNNVTWSLDTETGVLKIEGKGEMKDYPSSGSVPWYKYRSNIRTAKIGSGVTSIGYSAFFSCSSLTSITIPNGMTSIGGGAFGNCKSLTSITIPSSVTSIGDVAFNECYKLTKITFEKNSQLLSIGNRAFYRSALTSITIPSSVASIGNDAFYECKSLASITIPSSVTSIGARAFKACKSLTNINVNKSNESYKSISGVLFTKDGKTLIAYPMNRSGTTYTIPANVEHIEDDAFYCCSKLTSITMPNSLKKIGKRAFYACKLASITIPSGVISIGDQAFYEGHMWRVTFGENSQLKSIGNRAFQSCFALIRFTIPGETVSIGDASFSNCRKLESLEIPSSVTSIGEGAFVCCDNLTGVNADKENENYKSIDGILFTKDEKN